MRLLPLLCRLLLVAALAAPQAAWATDDAATGPVTIFAAASLRGALDAAAEGHGGAVRISYGGSGAMARQIAAGAPADAVILANEDWMDWLAEQPGIDLASGPVDLLANRLVLVAPLEETRTVDPGDILSALGDDDRIAMGQRDAVPAGRYARQWLEATGQWPGLQDRLAETDDVRAALLLVSRRQVPLGIVYATDALADRQVRVLHEVPPALHDPIRYPAAALTPAGAAFLRYLGSDAALETFASHGFASVPGES